MARSLVLALLLVVIGSSSKTECRPLLFTPGADTPPVAGQPTEPVLKAADTDGSLLSGLAAVPLYVWRSVFSEQQGPVCPFYPSCSAYGKEAIESCGPVRGWLMASERYLRDHAWAAEDGYDVVGCRFADPVRWYW